MRLHGFDYLRGMGMLAVIYIHGCDTSDVARRGAKWLGFAVPCFFMMSVLLAHVSVSKNDEPYHRVISSRFKRLGLPFLAWSAVYLLVRYVKSRATGAEMESGLIGSIFWGDASHQLYFVPMLFYLLCVWIAVMMLVKSRPVVLSALCAAAIVGSLLFESSIEEALPANRWFFAKNLIWFPIGILIAQALKRFPQHRTRLFWPSVLAIAVLLMTQFVNVYAVSLAAFLLALSIESPPPKAISFLSKYSFGAYLSHVLIIESLQFILPRMGADLSRLSITLSIIVAAAAGAYAICALLGKSERTRWSVT